MVISRPTPPLPVVDRVMQIQLLTGQHFAQTAGIRPTINTLFDPEMNIVLGTGYLRLLIDRFGDLRTALAAYHVGPTEIGRRIVENESFSDRYGREIRQRETFFTAMPRPAAPAPTPAAEAAVDAPKPTVVTASAVQG
jgi:hypothetical protein